MLLTLGQLWPKKVCHYGAGLMFLSITYVHLVSGQCVKNVTIKDCNRNQVLTTVNNCTKCVCRLGFYHHDALGVCQACDNCDYPLVVRKNCTQMSNTKCGVCKKTYYRTTSGCKKCQKCEHGVLMPCGKDSNTICVPGTMMPTTPTETSTINLKLTNGSQADYVTEKDWKQKPIWAILFIISLIIIVVLIVILCVVCKNSSRMLYMPTDTSSLATSLSSLLLTKLKFPDITALSEQERSTLICELPGGYADFLGQLLNPNVPNNWVQLAYEFNLTLLHIANLKQSSECTQDLLLYLCSRNTTVDMLLKALKNIKREDACVKLVNFMLNLRNDTESDILLIN